MTLEEYRIMRIRQRKILEHQIDHLQQEKATLDDELGKIPDKEFSRLKAIADGQEHYHTL